MSRKVLTPAAAMEIKRLYALMDDKGNHVHSQMEIADLLGVGETTVYRAIHRRGGYAAVRELPTDVEAAASKAKFLAANPTRVEGKMEAAIAERKEQAAAGPAIVQELAALDDVAARAQAFGASVVSPVVQPVEEGEHDAGYDD